MPAWKPHFAANSIMQTCRLPTISSKQFACFIQCNYYIFCLSIQTGRLERQVSLQDNNCLGQFGYTQFRDTKGIRFNKPHPNKQKTFFICNFLTVNYIITPIYLLKYQRWHNVTRLTCMEVAYLRIFKAKGCSPCENK